MTNPNSFAVQTRDWQRFIETVEDYAMFMLDVTGHVVTWNRGAQKINGYEASEILGRHFSTFYLQEDIAADKPGRELVEALTHGRVEDEGWRLRKDGSRFWANVVLTALRDDDGELRGFGKVTRDLTARLQAEETLRNSEERFRLLVESVEDYAIFMLDPEGRIATWNRGAQAIKGYQTQEIVGTHFSRFYSAEDRAAGKPLRMLAAAATAGRTEDEGWRVRKDGTLFWASVVLTALRDAQGHLVGFTKVTRDLTARREAEEAQRQSQLMAQQLAREQIARAAAQEAEARIRASAELAEKAAREAEEASRLKDEFLATVSHELRTPLNAIVGWSSLLRKRALEPELHKGLDVIHRNAVAQGRIIEDILDVSRIITGKLRLDLGLADFAAIVRDAIDVVGPAASARDIKIHLHLPEHPCRLYVDAERLQQVVWNLLSNAVKFGKKGGSITLRIELVDSAYMLTVRDDGQGIAAEFLPFVFDRFKQADSSSTRRIGGLGLGLALVRHLVELHGGRVAVSSPGVGHGAEFKVMLPVRPILSAAASAHDPKLPREPLGASPEQGALGRVRVLVVDDEADARELIATVLGAAGAETRTAGSSAEGYDAFLTFRPHVVVSDVGMPDEDGYTFIRRLRALAPADGGDVAALALTAYARAQDRAAALGAGFNAHLGKPIEPDELLSAVRQLAKTP